MKRQIQILCAFIIILFVGCIIAGFVTRDLPPLLARNTSFYKFLISLRYFIQLMPAVLSGAYLIGFSLIFGKNHEQSKSSFSPKMFERYRNVLISALSLVFIISIGNQAFLPVINRNISALEMEPTQLDLYVSMAVRNSRLGNRELAFLNIKKASEIDPDDERVKRYLTDFQVSAEYIEPDTDIDNKISIVTNEKALILPDTCFGLLQLSKKAAAEENWMDAHYYARMAVSVATSKDISLSDAEIAAAYAWNKLSEVSNTGDKITQQLFERKMEGYNALLEGDVLRAYYIFNELKLAQSNPDADIKRYFDLSEEALKKHYFFNDELDNLQKYETISDMCFKLSNPNGSSEVYFMRGVTNIRDQGNLIRYLRDFSVTYFDSDGHFVKRITVPYAKMFSVSTGILSDFQKASFSIDEKKSFVPYVLLFSVNRKFNSGVEKPKYKYPDGAFDNSDNESNYLILPLEYEKFTEIVASSEDVNSMDLFDLLRFVPMAEQLGYSSIVYNTILQERFLYPFTLLILLLFFAIMAWNYRVSEDVAFKFKWIFIIPFFISMVYVFLTVLFYLLRLLNFYASSICGIKLSLVFAIVVYILMFIALSVVFLSRKE